MAKSSSNPIHTLTLAALLIGLRNTSEIMDKAEKHATANSIPLETRCSRGSSRTCSTCCNSYNMSVTSPLISPAIFPRRLRRVWVTTRPLGLN